MRVITVTGIQLMVLQLCGASLYTINENQVSEGRAKYGELSQSSSLPHYGPCWLAALSQLHSQCDQLTEESHSRLALQFANCQLVQSGQKSFPCGSDESISSCLESVDSIAWTSYTSFYTHTHNMCHFLKSQQWREETDQTISKLSQTSNLAVQKLEESQRLQAEIAGSQRDSLEYQRQLVENGTFLNQAIEASRGSVQEMMEEFKHSTLEQRNMIFEVFDRVSRLQNLVVSEVSWLYTVVFYCFSLLVIYLVTATKRTADARIWLFLLLTVNFGVERVVIKLSLPSDSKADVQLGEIVTDRVWLARNTTVLISFLTLAIMAVRYKDYNMINNQLLEEIRRQNLDLKRSMENYQADTRDKYNLGRRHWVDSLDGQIQQPQLHLSKDIQAMLSEDTGYRGDEEEDEFSDSDDSFNSTRSDRTFDAEDFNFSTTGGGSRETTPTPQNDINLAMEEISSSLVSSTPVKTIPQLSDNSLLDTSRYNLRPRSRASTSSTTSNMSRISSVVRSPQSSQVKALSSTQKRNQRKLKMLQVKEEFSADES